MQPLPNQLQPFVSAAKGGLLLITSVWSRYLQQFTQAPPNVMNVSVDVSPFSYTAKEPGYIIVSNGTVSKINLIRGSTIIDLTGEKIIPVSISDTVEIIFSVVPTVQFIPIYGSAASP